MVLTADTHCLKLMWTNPQILKLSDLDNSFISMHYAECLTGYNGQ